MSIYRCLSCTHEWSDSSFFSGVKGNGCPMCGRNILKRIEVSEVTKLTNSSHVENVLFVPPADDCDCHMMIGANNPPDHCVSCKDKAILIMEFPSQEHIDAFTGWMSNSGEQSLYQQMDFEDKDKEYLYRTNLDYTNPNRVIVTQIPEDE
jgi:DNA-directed RNA polymerase subunit RPC12/RpoP